MPIRSLLSTSKLLVRGHHLEPVGSIQITSGQALLALRGRCNLLIRHGSISLVDFCIVPIRLAPQAALTQGTLMTGYCHSDLFQPFDGQPEIRLPDSKNF